MVIDEKIVFFAHLPKMQRCLSPWSTTTDF